MKSRVRSNKPFNYSRPYPSGFHAFKNRTTDQTSAEKEVDLSSITFPGAGIPWNSQTCSWTLPTPHAGVMQFTGSSASTNVQTPGTSSSGLIAQSTLSKRKYDLNCPIPRKQHISEERMAAHFKSLSISLQDSDSDEDQNVFPSTSASSLQDRKKTNRPMTTEELQESIKNGKKFVVSEELRKSNKISDNLLPYFLAKLEKPCTALIPWKPLLSIEDLVSKNEEQQPPPAPPENDEDLGILVDYDEDNNNLDIVNLNNNNNNNVGGMQDQNQNDFGMEMD